MPNVQCRSCGLVYKRRWLPSALLQRLFQDKVPAHPKGWDAVSDRFRPENFVAELKAYRDALSGRDQEGIARWRRALTSIVESIPELSSRPERREILAAVAHGDCERVAGYATLIAKLMNEPVPFSRFTGFRSEAIWNWCERIIGPIEAYAELGCPLWGLLPIARARGVRVSFLTRAEPNYWSGACQKDNRSCLAHLESTIGIHQSEWQRHGTETYTLIGAFQYLDHLEAPGAFMRELFDRARSCALILDRLDRPLALQHFTGWTESAIAWLAQRFGKCVHDDFEPIRASGNHLYLLAEPA
jgi:hypothetical protein